MKVTHIEVHTIHPEYDELVDYELQHIQGPTSRTVYVVHTDTGEIGLGEGSAEPEEVLAQYIGTSPFEWVNDVTSLAIGTAMYDLMGKSVGLPTYLLRQTFLLALPLFRSTDIFDGADTSCSGRSCDAGCQSPRGPSPPRLRTWPPLSSATRSAATPGSSIT